MVSTRLLLLGIGAVVAGIAIPYLSKIKRLAEELLSEAKVQIHKVSLDGVELRVKVVLKNPTGASLTVKQPFVKLFYGDKVVASSQVENVNVTIPKYSEVNLGDIAIIISLLSLATTAPLLVKEFREKGTMTLAVETITTINDKLAYSKKENIIVGGGLQA